MSTAPGDRPARSGTWIVVLAWAALALSAPLLTNAAWFAYDAVTSTSKWAAPSILMTVAIAVPVVPGGHPRGRRVAYR